MYKDLVDSSGEFNTPRYLFDYLNTYFPIELDPCATPDNYLGAKYFITKEQDGLNQEWRFDAFVNPPYGAKNEKLWIEKTIKEHKKNLINVFILLPNKTEASWFYDLYVISNIVIFPQKRINFIKNGKTIKGNTMGSVIFGLTINAHDSLLAGLSNSEKYVRYGVKKFFFPSRDFLMSKYGSI